MNKNTKTPKKLGNMEVVTFPKNPHEGEAWSQTKIKAVWLPIDQLTKWGKNPRHITAKDLEKLKNSLSKNPEFAQKRPLLVNHTVDKKGVTTYTVYAGNMRLSAMKALGWPLAPCIVEKDIPKKRLEEEALKDNIEYGQWDFDILANEFDEADLQEMDLPEKEMWLFEVGKDDLVEGMDLPTGEKQPFVQRTFTLANAQAEAIDAAMSEIMKTQEYKYMVTHGNQNNYGNALALIIEQWAQQKI